MSTAGEYDTLFAWGVHSRPAPNTIGEKAAVYTPSGTLWGAIDEPSAAPEEDLNSAKNVLRTVVRIRNRIPIKPLDRLEDSGTAEAWTVDAVHFGAVETVCEVSR